MNYQDGHSDDSTEFKISFPLCIHSGKSFVLQIQLKTRICFLCEN